MMSHDSGVRHEWKLTALDHFQVWADHYDRDVINYLLFKPTYRRVTEQLRRFRRRGLSTRRILDIGCGTGTLAIEYLSRLGSVTSICGLDMSDNMVARAESKRNALALGERVHFMIGDSEHLPFEDNQFDVITCCNSFHHYPHQDRAIREMKRVLNKGGRAIIVDGNRDDVLGYFIFEVCVALKEKHVHHCTAERYRRLFNEAGFDHVYQNVFGVCPPVLLNVAYV